MASIAFASLQKVVDLAKSIEDGEDLYLRIVSSSRLAVGVDPLHPTHIIDIGREAVAACNGAGVSSTASLQSSSDAPMNGSASTDAQ